MKKNLVTLALSMLAAVGQAQPTVDRMVVRQQWPWFDGIRVEFVLVGVASQVDVAVSAMVGGDVVAIPDDALSGRRYGLNADGTYALVIDPSRVPALATLTEADDLGFSLSVTNADERGREVLYKTFRLADNAWTDITRGELLNGDYGAVETDYGRIGEGYNTTLDDVCIWTGVTNDTKWATDYIVLRKIPAGNFTFNPSPYSTVWPTNDNCSRITYDYWIGVFPMTQAQYADIYAKGNSKATEWHGGTGSGYEWQFGNIHTNSLAPQGSLCTTQVTGNWIGWHRAATAYTGNQCFFARLYTRSGFKFRCPSAFEWMKAARGGAPYRSCYYDGVSLFRFTSYSAMAWNETGKTAADYVVKLGRFRTNGDGTPAPVGSYRPNAYGLYDMLGNICEPMEDTFRTDNATANAYISPETMRSGLITDFYGATDDYNKSVSGGGWYGSNSTSGMLWDRQFQTHSGQRLEQIGLRICISDEEFQATE